MEDSGNDGTSNLIEEKNGQGMANLENTTSYSKDGDPKMTRVSLEYFLKNVFSAHSFTKPY